MNNKLSQFFEAFSLSGAIICGLFVVIMYGVVLSGMGNPNGEKIWTTFTTALTTFVAGKHLNAGDTPPKA